MVPLNVSRGQLFCPWGSNVPSPRDLSGHSIYSSPQYTHAHTPQYTLHTHQHTLHTEISTHANTLTHTTHPQYLLHTSHPPMQATHTLHQHTYTDAHHPSPMSYMHCPHPATYNTLSLTFLYFPCDSLTLCHSIECPLVYQLTKSLASRMGAPRHQGHYPPCSGQWVLSPYNTQAVDTQ